MITRKSLSEYVDEVMKQKGFDLKAVVRNSRGLISKSYLHSIVLGNQKNPTVEKLQALARGLKVNEDELFDVARGIDPKMRGRFGDLFLDELFRKCAELEPSRRAKIDGTLQMLDGFVDKLLSEQIGQEQEKKRA